MNKLDQLTPRPQRAELRSQATVPVSDPAVVLDPALPPQGFQIDISADGTRITHADEAGLRYALDAVDQLTADAQRPDVFIEDWPDFPERGFMLDISRDRVPTRSTLSRMVGLLAAARYNHFELYTEHTYEHPGHEVVWGDASPITGEDLEWLDRECSAVGIELVANQNTFGHMERWLKHPDYLPLAESQTGNELFPGFSMPPMVLAPTEDNAAFAVELVRNQLAHVSSRTVNIGCDETFELGKGISADAVAERGKAIVYAEHLARLATPLLEDGARVLFWGDMIQSHPEALASLPDGDMVPIAWCYERPMGPDAQPEIPEMLVPIIAELGIDIDGMSGGFERILEPYRELDRPFWVAPGTSTWNSIVGRIDNAKANLLDAAVAGLDAGASGMLVTEWGDNGHLQQFAASFAPLLYGGAVAWCAETNADLDLAETLDRVVLQDDSGVVGTELIRLGELWDRTGQKAFNGSPIQAGLCSAQMQFVTGEPDADLLREVIATIDDSIAALATARPQCSDGALVVREMTLGARLARHGAGRLLEASGGEARPPEDLAAELRTLIAEYRSVWLERSRPGGLDDSAAHLESTLQGYT